MSRPITCVKESLGGGLIRRCHTCETWKAQTAEHFYVIRAKSEIERTRTHMFHPQCRPCARKVQRDKRKADPSKQAKATRRVRDNTRNKRRAACELLKDVQLFLATLPTYGTVADVCAPARKLKQAVDLYVLTEEPHMERSHAMLDARKNGQVTKHK